MMNEQRPNISVVLSNYNGERYLAEALQSVLNQDYEAYEFIVVDDGSTDRSQEIIAEFAGRHGNRLRPIYLPHNRGQAAGFNTGVNAARGALISFMDSDDIWFPDKLSRVARTFGDRTSISLHHHNLRIVRDGELTEELYLPALVSGPVAAFGDFAKEIPRFAPTSALTFSRRALERIGPVPEAFKICADGYLTRAAMCFGDAAVDDEVCGGYRRHDANATGTEGGYDPFNYIHNFLLPHLFAFYERHNVPWRFGHATDAELADAFSAIPLDQGRIVVMRCAPHATMGRMLAALRVAHPDAEVDLLVQESARATYRDLPLRTIPIADGFLNERSIATAEREELLRRDYDFALIPYNTWHPGPYINVNALLCRLVDCPVVGIGTDGSLYDCREAMLRA